MLPCDVTVLPVSLAVKYDWSLDSLQLPAWRDFPLGKIQHRGSTIQRSPHTSHPCVGIQPQADLCRVVLDMLRLHAMDMKEGLDALMESHIRQERL